MASRMRHKLKAVCLVGLCVPVALTACFSLGRKEPPHRYYVLGAAALENEATPTPELAGLTLGVRRAQLASYLATPFIVVRRGAHQISFSEFHRWGEPLEAGIDRVVAASLLSRGIGDAVVAPWPPRARYDYVVQLDVLRFEGLAPEEPAAVGGGVRLLATWEITRQQDGAVLARGTTHYHRSGWTVGDYAALVTLLDEGLDVLSGDLIASLEQLRAP